MDKSEINPKVHAQAIGGTIGGGTLAVLLLWILQDGLGMSPASFTADRVVAITALCTGMVGWLSGYMKKSED